MERKYCRSCRKFTYHAFFYKTGNEYDCTCMVCGRKTTVIKSNDDGQKAK